MKMLAPEFLEPLIEMGCGLCYDEKYTSTTPPIPQHPIFNIQFII
jgi:hypothetical protein